MEVLMSFQGVTINKVRGGLVRARHWLCGGSSATSG